MDPAAHLVGSMTFATSEAAMRAVGEAAGDVVKWVPDGEPGQRRKWMGQHQQRFAAVEGIERQDRDGRANATSGAYFGLQAGAGPSQVKFGSFGYADAAAESYAVFRALKQGGSLPPDARFQVSIPPPSEVLSRFIVARDRDALEPAIERALLADLAAVEDRVPHHELAIQWDIAVEIAMLEGIAPAHLDSAFDWVVERLVAAGDAVSADVALAYHLCYGSPYDVHFKEPEDTGLMVRLVNALLSRLDRSPQRVHMPVPIGRDDAAYFAPLADLRLTGTELFLGLVHHEDGVDGARRRVAAAKRFVDEFGVATECGSGRTRARPDALMRLHVEVAEIASQPRDESVDVPKRPRPRPPVNAERVDAELREFSETSPCGECGVAAGEPCRDPDGSLAGRPHMDRYHDALLIHVGQAEAS